MLLPKEKTKKIQPAAGLSQRTGRLVIVDFGTDPVFLQRVKNFLDLRGFSPAIISPELFIAPDNSIVKDAELAVVPLTKENIGIVKEIFVTVEEECSIPYVYITGKADAFLHSDVLALDSWGFFSIGPNEESLDSSLRIVLKKIRKLASYRDDLVASLGEKELLIKELHHRVKNNFQMISSMMNLKMDSIKDQEAIERFKECQNAIIAMAVIHEKLYQSGNLPYVDVSVLLNTLSRELIASFDVDITRIELKFELEPIILHLETAVPTTLVLNELITNVFKHAFPLFYLNYGKESYEKAAYLNFRCRKAGVTIRSTLHLLIAEIAIENNLYLLHNDKDFENMSRCIAELRTYKWSKISD